MKLKTLALASVAVVAAAPVFADGAMGNLVASSGADMIVLLIGLGLVAAGSSSSGT